MKKGKGRTVYIDNELYERVRTIALDVDRSESYVINKAIEKLVKSEEQLKKYSVGVD